MQAMRYLVLLIAFVMGTPAMAAAKPGNDGKWRRLAGTTLKAALSDMELGDGAHYTYRFHADGSFDGTEMSRDIRGTWRATPEALCWRWVRPPGREECYTVERKGRELRGSRNGYEAWWGELAPLAPASK